MAYTALRTTAGTRKRTNEDSCCVEVAQTALGEMLMAVVCDGVGGLSRGDLASATVVKSFVSWFETELPVLLEPMMRAGAFDFAQVRVAWDTRLKSLNSSIKRYGERSGATLGTTFTGVIACGGHYLVGHVGDCRAYLMSPARFEQVTEDQTVAARQLAEGKITPDQARRMPKNAIWQAVGTGHTVAPAFCEGSLLGGQLFAICCDGAYKRAGNEGVRRLFQGLDYCDEGALDAACQALLQRDMELGEKDNLTVVCFAGALEGAGTLADEGPTPSGHASAPSLMTDGAAGWSDEDDAPTVVELAEPAGEDDLPTVVDMASDEDDAPTVMELLGDEDDAPTVVDLLGDEDDAPTVVEQAESGEDDLPTVVELAEPDEDDAPTVVDLAEPDEDDLPTVVEGSDA